MQRLAAQLAQRMPWLARNWHIGALARLLHRHQLNSDTGWTADRVLRMLELHNRATGRVVPDPADQRNPLGYLNWILTTADLEQVTPPAAPVQRAASSWELEGAERRRLIAGEDPSVRAAIIAQIRVDIAAERVARPAPCS